MKCYDAYNQKSWDVSFTLRSGAIGGDGTPVVYGAGGGEYCLRHQPGNVRSYDGN